jgi:hypothetical protein
MSAFLSGLWAYVDWTRQHGCLLSQSLFLLTVSTGNFADVISTVLRRALSSLSSIPTTQSHLPRRSSAISMLSGGAYS